MAEEVEPEECDGEVGVVFGEGWPVDSILFVLRAFYNTRFTKNPGLRPPQSKVWEKLPS